jgi:hypothetical protein
MRVSALLALALVAAGLLSGCVTRRILITSDPPGATVYRDNQPLGPTPVQEPFVYYGKYRYRLVKDGFAPLDVEPELVAPWYQYTGIDLIAENFIPFTFRDTQHLHFELKPLEQVPHDVVRSSAEALRAQGQTIGPPPGTQPRRSRKENSFVPEAPPLTGITLPSTSGAPSREAP